MTTGRARTATGSKFAQPSMRTRTLDSCFYRPLPRTLRVFVLYCAGFAKRATLERCDSEFENIAVPVELRMPNIQTNDKRAPWHFTSGHLYCLSNQSKSTLKRNFRELLVSSSRCSKVQRLRVRDRAALVSSRMPFRPIGLRVENVSILCLFWLDKCYVKPRYLQLY